MKDKNSKRKILRFALPFCVLISAFYISASAFAAELAVSAKSGEIKTGDLFVADFTISADESINALEGAVSLPPDLLDVKEIRDGNSIVNFWVEKPREEQGKIIFSGITPGGFRGANGLIFSIIFRAKKSGEGVIGFQNVKALKNDGLGTPTKVEISDLRFLISDRFSPSPIVQTKDTEPPESFVPEISRSESVFGSKWFVAFATQDKGSGIDHYEIKESKQKLFSLFQRWMVAESPYVLGDQELRSYVFVKAVDKAGNVRIEEISPRHPLAWYENYENWAIIIVITGIIAAFIVSRFRKSKFKYQK